jgi:hypothetical protein
METDKAVDAKRVGVHGHSRWGKAALVAMAFDERFAIGYISSSGQGGAKLHRRKYGETIDNVANTFYYWMAGNYMKYAGHWDALPVDAHELIALVAPRPVFLSGGNGPGALNPDGTVQANDAWIDPRGSFMAAVAAGPVYRLLGRKDLGTTEYPPLDTAVIEGDLGFRQHTGGHTPGPTWPTFLTFAERYLGAPPSAVAGREGRAGQRRRRRRRVVASSADGCRPPDSPIRDPGRRLTIRGDCGVALHDWRRGAALCRTRARLADGQRIRGCRCRVGRLRILPGGVPQPRRGDDCRGCRHGDVRVRRFTGGAL